MDWVIISYTRRHSPWTRSGQNSTPLPKRYSRNGKFPTTCLPAVLLLRCYPIRQNLHRRMHRHLLHAGHLCGAKRHFQHDYQRLTGNRQGALHFTGRFRRCTLWGVSGAYGTADAQRQIQGHRNYAGLCCRTHRQAGRHHTGMVDRLRT